MKRIFILFAAVVMSAGIAAAQDMAQATELYNNGAMELEMGNTAAALENFQNALAMAETLGDEGADMVTNCKTYIPQLMLSVAKGMIKEENYDGAVEQLNKTIETSNLYEAADVAEEASGLIPQVYMTKGNNLLNEKNFAEAVPAYQKALEIDATNGMAALRLGMALASLGKADEAEAAFVQAAANGQETNANKQLSNMFVKKAQASSKAKKYQEVLDFAAKSNQYLENANAYRLAAGAAQQLGKNAECIASYEKYLELKPNAKDAAGVKFTIAALYQQTGDKAKAKEYYQAISNDPQYGPSAQEQLKTL